MPDFTSNLNIQTNLPNLPTLVENVVNQFIVNPISPSGKIGISGYVFDIVGMEEMVIDSDITDHFLEDNTAIQDHIALRPERFVLSGYVGELSDIFSNTFLSILTNIQSLGTIAGLAPQFSIQATKIYGDIASVASKVGEVFNQAQNIFDIFSQNASSSTNQKRAFDYFYNAWKSRILCQVQTPYGIFNNMAIESLRAKQDENTRLMSDFSVTFKMIRTAKTDQFSLLPSVGRAASALASTAVNSGTTTGPEPAGDSLTQTFALFK